MDDRSDRTYKAAMAPLAELLRRQMAEHPITQGALAERFGVSQPTIGRWLDGSSTPDAKHVADLADYLGCTEDDVIRAMHQQRRRGKQDLSERVVDLSAEVVDIREQMAALRSDHESLRSELGSLASLLKQRRGRS